MKKLTTAAIGAAIAGTALLGGASTAGAATTTQDQTTQTQAEAQAYYDQAKKDWGLMINEYFPGGYIPYH